MLRPRPDARRTCSAWRARAAPARWRCSTTASCRARSRDGRHPGRAPVRRAVAVRGRARQPVGTTQPTRLELLTVKHDQLLLDESVQRPGHRARPEVHPALGELLDPTDDPVTVTWRLRQSGQDEERGTTHRRHVRSFASPHHASVGDTSEAEGSPSPLRQEGPVALTTLLVSLMSGDRLPCASSRQFLEQPADDAHDLSCVLGIDDQTQVVRPFDHRMARAR